jgi:5-methylcytosine-specific restriction enzyme A
MKKTGPKLATVVIVWARAGGVCERCGCRSPEQCHHRKPRGAGGSSDPAINQPPNLLALCSPCHVEVESDREGSYANGWLVRYRHVSAEVPVLHAAHGWVRLTEDGGFEPAEPIAA